MYSKLYNPKHKPETLNIYLLIPRASSSGSIFFAVRGSKGTERVFARDHCHATNKDEAMGLHEKENDDWKKRGEIGRFLFVCKCIPSGLEGMEKVGTELERRVRTRMEG